MSALPKFTAAQISGALSRLFQLPPDHPGIARYAGDLLGPVNEQPELRAGGLDGGGFKAMAIGGVPADVVQDMNPARRDELQREAALNGNVTGAAFAKAVAESRIGARELRLVEGSGENSRRFGELTSGGRPPDPVSAGAYDYAMRTPGMAWATNNPDLLRMGRPALEALAAVRVDQPTYAYFKKNFRASDAEFVEIAKEGKKKGINDFSALRKEMQKTDALLTPEQQQERYEKYKGYILAPEGSPEAEAAKRDVLEMQQRHEQQSPALQERYDAERKRMNIKVESREAKLSVADADRTTKDAERSARDGKIEIAGHKQAKAEDKEIAALGILGGLNAGAGSKGVEPASATPGQKFGETTPAAPVQPRVPATRVAANTAPTP